MAGRLLTNLIVMGGTVVGRAMLQAYRQAIVNANKTGAAQEAINGIKWASKAMTEQEAWQILGISENRRGKRLSRSMTQCLRGMPRMGASISSQRFIERKNAWNLYIKSPMY